MSVLKKLVYRLRGFTTLDELRKLGLTYGEDFNPQFPFFLDPSHCWLITIGDNVTFAPNVYVFAHDASTCKQIGYAKIGQVNIGDNVFVGAGSIILPGVTIGNNSIIGAGAVVTHDVPENMVYAGNPAVAISSVAEYRAKNEAKIQTRPVYGGEYTLRQNMSEEKKTQQKQELSDGIGFVK